ncbi:MAG: hypothetical protein JJT76_06420 [Clostridiaceae bacterium]|nr:hypothetical protein [Clostridiaceae bacterium]
MKRLVLYFMLGMIVFSGCSFGNTEGDTYEIKFRQRVKVESKIEALKEEDIHFIRRERPLFKTPYYTLSMEQTEYAYIGKLKKNKPHGIGVLLKLNYSLPNNFYSIEYAGNFKKGIMHGYGIEYAKPTEETDLYYEYRELESIGVRYIKYEGYFKNGKYEGKGNYYALREGLDFSETLLLSASNNINQYYENNKEEIESFKDQLKNENRDYLIIAKLPLLNNQILYTGKFKKNEFEGKGKQFVNDILVYEGRFSKSEYHGKGKLYYYTDSNTIKYKGRFNRGQYHGKGTLYEENGNVKYSGKWKNGQPE